MKQWLIILIFGLTAAVTQAAEESTTKTAITEVILSQSDGTEHNTSNVPLVATATTSLGTTHLAGTEYPAGKPRSSGDELTVYRRADVPHHIFSFGTLREGYLFMYSRPADRYVYGLRKIII